MGLTKIEAAKKDGAWHALDDVEILKLPDDLTAALTRVPARLLPTSKHFRVRTSAALWNGSKTLMQPRQGSSEFPKPGGSRPSMSPQTSGENRWAMAVVGQAIQAIQPSISMRQSFFLNANDNAVFRKRRVAWVHPTQDMLVVSSGGWRMIHPTHAQPALLARPRLHSH